MKKSLFFGLLFTTSCGLFDDSTSIKSFYFPIKKLKNGLIYAFQPVGADSAAVEYWYVRSEKRDGNWWLMSQYYQPDFSLGQNVVEQIFDDGAVAKQVFLYENDSISGKARQIPTKISDGNMFPFLAKDSTEIYRFALDWQPDSTRKTTIFLKRTRRFSGSGEPFFFKNNKIETVRFALREIIGNAGEGNAEIEGAGEEIYAKNLGLVAYKKEYRGGLKLNFRLIDTFRMPELERRAKAFLVK
jgi:hypothetical protein